MNSTTQRSATENTLALAIVVILNWLMAHLATSWAMPSEVQSALQSIITISIAYYLSKQPAAPKPAPLPVAAPPAPTPPIPTAPAA